MDDRGALEQSRLATGTAGAGSSSSGLYGPSAAAAVNSGMMQLPSVADTAGRLGVVDPGLPSGFGCPPNLHVDYSNAAAISAIGPLAQLRGWYGPGIQTQGSACSDMFGSYTGPTGGWRNLSTPPTAAPDHFHSPLPGMTHPMWPCPPAPVPCSEGCSLSYYNPPSMYSPYSAYFSMMSSSAAGDYSPYMSPPRFPGPMTFYQQRLHDMHKAYLLANASGSHATSDFPSPWNHYMTGSSAGTSLPSPGYMGTGGHLGLAFNIDASSTSGKCTDEEQKQVIKQEPMSNRTKAKELAVDQKNRDTRRDQHRTWEHSSLSKEVTSIPHESKPGVVTKKQLHMKDEKLLSPTSSDCFSLDLRNNNNKNNSNYNKPLNGSDLNNSVQQNLDLQSSVDVVAPTNVIQSPLDCKPYLTNLCHADDCEPASTGRTGKFCQDNSCSFDIENNTVMSESSSTFDNLSKAKKKKVPTATLR